MAAPRYNPRTGRRSRVNIAQSLKIKRAARKFMPIEDLRYSLFDAEYHLASLCRAAVADKPAEIMIEGHPYIIIERHDPDRNYKNEHDVGTVASAKKQWSTCVAAVLFFNASMTFQVKEEKFVVMRRNPKVKALHPANAYNPMGKVDLTNIIEQLSEMTPETEPSCDDED